MDNELSNEWAMPNPAERAEITIPLRILGPEEAGLVPIPESDSRLEKVVRAVLAESAPTDISEFEQSGLAAHVLAVEHALLFSGVPVPEIVKNADDRRTLTIECLETYLEMSDSTKTDIELLEHYDHLDFASDRDVRANGLLPVLGMELEDLNFAGVAYEDTKKIAEELAHGPSPDQEKSFLNCWDELTFAPYEHEAVHAVHSTLYSNPDMHEAFMNIDVLYRGDFFARSLKNMLKLVDLKHFVLRNHHYGGETGRYFNAQENGTGVFYDLSDHIRMVVETSKYKASMRLEMKEMEFDEDSDDSAVVEWTKTAIEEMILVSEIDGARFVAGAMKALSSDEVEPFCLAPLIKDMPGEDEEDEYDVMAMTGKMKERADKRSGGESNNKIDFSAVPDFIKDPREKELFSKIIRPNPEHTFAMVGGLEDIKQRIIDICDEIKYKDEISLDGVNLTSSLLLASEPGFGKGMFAESIANYLDAYYLKVTADAINDMWQGESEKYTAALFSLARKLAEHRNVVLFFNEFDTLFANREGGGGSGTDNKQTGQILNGLEEPYPGVLMLAATNYIGDIDKAMIRSGRFDDHIEIKTPDAAGMEIIFDKRIEFHLSKAKTLELDTKLETAALGELAHRAKLNGADISTAVGKAIKMRRIQANKANIDALPLSTEMIKTELEKIIAKGKSKKVGF